MSSPNDRLGGDSLSMLISLTELVQRQSVLIERLVSEVADLKTRVQRKETTAERRDRLQSQAIQLLAKHGPVRRAIADELGIAESTMRGWDQFNSAMDAYRAIERGQRKNRYTAQDETDIE